MKKVTEQLQYLEEKIAMMSEQLNDTLLMVTADHGHIDVPLYIDRLSGNDGNVETSYISGSQSIGILC